MQVNVVPFIQFHQVLLKEKRGKGIDDIPDRIVGVVLANIPSAFQGEPGFLSLQLRFEPCIKALRRKRVTERWRYLQNRTCRIVEGGAIGEPVPGIETLYRVETAARIQFEIAMLAELVPVSDDYIPGLKAAMTGLAYGVSHTLRRLRLREAVHLLVAVNLSLGEGHGPYGVPVN